MSKDNTPSVLDAQRAVANPDGSPNILRFGDGLMLWVTPRQKMWRTKVQRNGKSSTLNLGRFPEVSIKAAKAKSAAIKVAADPATARRIERVQAVEATERTVRYVAAQWMESRGDKQNWTPLVRQAIERRLETYFLKKFGELPIGAIRTEDVEGSIKGVFRKYPRTAVALRQHLSGLFDYAVRRDWCPTNLVAKIAEDLPARKAGTEKNHPHLGMIEDARAVLAAIEARRDVASPYTLLAHRLIALTGVRGVEARGARWSEFDLDRAIWTVPAERMKGKDGNRRAHMVALSPQAIEVVRAAATLRKNEYLFPSLGLKGGVLDRSTLTRFIRDGLDAAKLGRVLVTHGWRGTFSTIMNELDDGASFRVVDVMLAHKGFRDAVDGEVRKSGVEGHYNHAEYRSARHRLACQWADLLLPPGASLSARALIGLDGAPASNVVQLARAA